MRIVLFTLLGVAVALVAAMAWQQLRYHRARRNVVQDLQPPLHSSNAFHVLTFVKLAEGQGLIESLRKLRNELESVGSAKVVYAGRIGIVPLHSEQLPQVDWDAVVLAQYPSRETYDVAARSSTVVNARAAFAESFAQGFRRSPFVNVAIPQALLGLRLWQIVTFQPSLYPLERASPEQIEERGGRNPEMLERIRERLGPYAKDAVVVVNLLQHGTKAQQAADRSYGFKMAGGFAEGGYGPMHLGDAVRLEGEADFDRVVLVYYPGLAYFSELMQSTFFQGIVGDKQPGDTQAAPTGPVLSLL